jgi:hypothetical protein
MTSGIAPRLLGALMAVAVWPAAVLAQGTSAGVVTTLSGQASVVRATADRAPLKFKDDVFLRDKISTGQQSIAKLLLGGKALVTVRELSTLTVTEEVGRSTVDLEAGKVALGVARSRMKPGEVVEIRTPNAIAAVRGTVVVVEVIQASAQATPGPVPVVTNLYVLSGTADILLRGVPGATPTSVGPGFGLSVTGGILGGIRPNPPTPQIIAGLQGGPHHREAPAQAKDQVAQTQQNSAAELATAMMQPGSQTAVTSAVTSVVRVSTSTPTPVVLPPILPGNVGTPTPPLVMQQPSTTFLPPFSGFVNWNASAFDLDLHSTGPAATGGRFHVFFGNTGSLTGQPFTLLHQDCICFSGNEAITIQQVNQGGVYRFSVFNFGSTVPLIQSGATFRFVQGGTVTNLSQGGSTVTGGTTLATIVIPTTGSGNTWVIGEYDPTNNTFRATNTITDSTSSSTVQLQAPKRRH